MEPVSLLLLAPDDRAPCDSRSSAAADDVGIVVEMNQARIFKLARPADTIVIGNPQIADAASWTSSSRLGRRPQGTGDVRRHRPARRQEDAAFAPVTCLADFLGF
jgi:Pilus formation protein N terminal region